MTFIPTSPPTALIYHSPSQLTALFSFAPHASFSINLRHRSTALLVRIRQQRALVELLRAGRHIDGRVAREEIDRLEADFEDFAGHDGEIFDARDLLIARACQREFGLDWVVIGDWLRTRLTWLMPNWTKTTMSVSTMGSLRSAHARTPVPPRDWLVYCEFVLARVRERSRVWVFRIMCTRRRCTQPVIEDSDILGND